MTFNQLIRRGERLVINNSPAIMTAIGIAGTLTTAYLTGKASFRAALFIEDNMSDYEGLDDSRAVLVAKVRDTWKLYVPALSVAAITCTAIVLSNRVSTRRATAVATAYALSEKAHEEYRTRVVEKLGEKKEKEVRTEMAQSRVERAGPTMIVATGTQVMCHDTFSNQFFLSDMETLRGAVNSINAQVLHSDYATVNDFYDFVNADGLEHTAISGDMGWNTDKMLEVDFNTVLHDDRTPCLSIDFLSVPMMTPWRFV